MTRTLPGDLKLSSVLFGNDISIELSLGIHWFSSTSPSSSNIKTHNPRFRLNTRLSSTSQSFPIFLENRQNSINAKTAPISQILRGSASSDRFQLMKTELSNLALNLTPQYLRRFQKIRSWALFSLDLKMNKLHLQHYYFQVFLFLLDNSILPPFLLPSIYYLPLFHFFRNDRSASLKHPQLIGCHIERQKSKPRTPHLHNYRSFRVARHFTLAALSSQPCC